jgi:gluconate 2-dehydrogenase gamma chain
MRCQFCAIHRTGGPVEPTSSRRAFLTQLGGMWLAVNLPLVISVADRARAAAARGDGFTTLSDAEARTFGAVAEQILPSGDLPGAREAGVVYFADLALGSFFADQLPDLRGGLAAIDGQARSRGGASFAELGDADQQAVMRQLEALPLFQGIWTLTIMGTFAEPRYGGNRDAAAARLLGFTRAPTYQPPFGFYDAHQEAGE